MARIIFMGSPEIAVPSLRALVEAGHAVPLVVTQPDRPKGRGRNPTPPPIKTEALKLGLRVLQPETVRSQEFLREILAQKADAVAVVAYGRILPKEIWQATPWGCINVHFSLLPKYRGAACVAHALIKGEGETGVTTMLIDEGLDTGPILMQWTEAIAADDTAATLAQRLAPLGAEQLVMTLRGLERGDLQPVPQDPALATLAPPLKKEMGHLNWNQPAATLYNLYRGLTPWPGVYGFLQGRRIILCELCPEAGAATGGPGTLGFDGEGLWVNAAEGRLRVTKLKPEGKRILSAAEFVRGLKQRVGLKLE